VATWEVVHYVFAPDCREIRGTPDKARQSGATEAQSRRRQEVGFAEMYKNLWNIAFMITTPAGRSPVHARDGGTLSPSGRRVVVLVITDPDGNTILVDQHV
jgi:hypothetical protein